MVEYRSRRSLELEDYTTKEKELTFRREVGRKISDIVHRGLVNWAGEVTLGTSSLTTTVEDDLVDAGSVLFFLATTLNASNVLPQLYLGDADFAYGAPWQAQEAGKFVVNHPNPLPANCRYRYGILG